MLIAQVPLRSRFDFESMRSDCGEGIPDNKCWAVFETTGGVWWIAVIVKGCKKQYDHEYRKKTIVFNE